MSPMKNIKKIVAFLAIGAILLLSVSMTFLAPAASAAGISVGGDQGQTFTDFKPGDSLELNSGNLSNSLTTTDDATEFILRVVNFALGFLGLIAVIIVIYGGVLYVTAAGEEEKTQTGKKAITYAAIGLLIVLGSFAFVNTIIRGAGGEEGAGNEQVIAGNTGSSFNAAASRVRSIAEDIRSSFIFFAQINDELKLVIGDANKASLSYEERLVPKADIQKALYSVQEKLNNIKSRADEYSGMSSSINSILSYLIDKIDEVGIAGNNVLSKIDGNGGLEVCTSDQSKKAELSALEGVTGTKLDIAVPEYDSEGNSTGMSQTCKGYSNYSHDLYVIWAGVNGAKKVLTSSISTSGPSMSNVIDGIKQATIEQTIDSLIDLDDIRQELSSTGVFSGVKEDNGLLEMYEAMTASFGDPYEAENGNYTTGGTTYLDELNAWTFSNYITNPSELDRVGAVLSEALELQLEFAEELENIKSVSARLRASTISGNAPLLVTFDVNESTDPAGGSLIGSNIDWTNIKGINTYEGVAIDTNDLAKAVECSYLVDDDATKDGSIEEAYSPTYKQCLFKYPGTYNATVVIKSNDPARYLPGMSNLIIKIDPPSTKIDLEVEVGRDQPIEIMKYYEREGVIRKDLSTVQVTLAEAESKDGLIFDASATKNVKSFKWDFGNGEIIEATTDSIQPVKYKTKGRYQVTLEVMNNQGEVDRKIFMVEVTDVAAFISITPSSNISIGDSITIDGSQSRSSSGPIKAYEWIITNQRTKIDEVLGVNTNKPTFVHKFKTNDEYNIHLNVITGDPEPAWADHKVQVISEPPQAIIKYAIPDSGQPAVVHLDGTTSFDPDGDSKNIEYTWTIKPDGIENWELFNGTGTEMNKATEEVKFKKKGEYEVTLKALDKTTKARTGFPLEYSEVTETIVIDDLLDIAWGEFESTGLLGKGDNDPGEATIKFKISSEKGNDYVIDFGDEEEGTGPISGDVNVTHNYTATGKYTVEATVYDDEDNGNSIKKSIYIGGGDSPIAKAAVFINGNEVYDLTSIIEVSKKDIITFDGSESRNIDGTGRNLKYSWNFGDTGNSSSKAATHSYDELSPVDPGYFTATLKAYDEDEASKEGEDEVYIKVVNKAPTFSAIQAVPASSSSDLITPVNVDVKAHNADDEDGEIIQYRWWYYDVDDPDEQLGVQITKGPTARVIVGTTGKEGKESTYGFGLEITDSENKTTQSEDVLQEAQIPKVTVTNGPNELPTAKFNVDTTSVFTGDSVRFTSASKDPDGTILEYIWDIEGDGFHNNEPTEASTLDYAYSIRDMEGYDVRLKVRDDKGGESISDIITIYVDSLAEPPAAAFNYEVVENSYGKKIQFTNNSEVDEDSGAEIISFVWDFDTESDFSTADSNGDGDLGNDTDSQAESPARLYTEYGEYTVKLTVTDNQGNSDEVERTMKIPLADPPVAAFTYQVVNGQVIFQNNSTADVVSGAMVKEYIWDFDTASQLPNADSDGDGVKDNDIDSDLEAPVKTYSIAGIYKVMLTVIDNSGSKDSVVNVVDTSEVGVSPGTSGDLVAALITNPLPSSDGIVQLAGAEGSVTFDFSKSEGAISYYIIDKNIYFDTDGNGIKNDDQDFKTTLPGTWKTNFEKAWGKTASKLTVIDIYENESSVTQEIKF